jgi:RNA 3'-terminal phosphate cyclase (ATP)
MAVEAANPVPFSLEAAQNLRPRSFVVTSSLPPTVADRAEIVLARAINGEVSKRVESGPSSGAAVTICLPHAGFSSLGERGKPMERVTQEAIDQMRNWSESGAAVDEHLADQLVLPALFASGPSRWRTNRVTEHVRTVLWVARQFIDFDYAIEESTGQVKVSPAEALRKP